MRGASSTSTCVPPCSSAFPSSSREDERERGRTRAGERDRLEPARHLAPGADALGEHRAQAVEQVGQVDLLVPLLGQHLVHRRDREDAVDRVLERLPRLDALVARLQAQQRGHRLQVVLDAVVDLLGEHAAHHGAPVLERDRRLLGDRGEQFAVVLGERRGAVGDELADLASAPAQRLADRVRVGAALGPGDRAVLEHERGAGRRRARPSSS